MFEPRPTQPPECRNPANPAETPDKQGAGTGEGGDHAAGRIGRRTRHRRKPLGHGVKPRDTSHPFDYTTEPLTQHVPNRPLIARPSNQVSAYSTLAQSAA